MADQGDDPSKRETKTWNSGAGGPPPSQALQAPAAPPRPAARQFLPTTASSTSTSRASLPAVTPTTELAAQRARIEELEILLGRTNQELSGARTTIQSLFETTEKQAAQIVQLKKTNGDLEAQVGDLVVQLAQSEHATLEATSVVLTDLDRRKASETVDVEDDVYVPGRNEEIVERPSLTAVAAGIAALLDAGAHDTDAHEPIHDQRRTMMGMVAAPPAPEATSQLPVAAPQPLPQTSRSLRHWHGSAGDTQPFGERQTPLEPPKEKL